MSVISAVAIVSSAVQYGKCAFAEESTNPNKDFTDEEIQASVRKPKITVESIIVNAEEAGGSLQTVNINVTGSENKYASTGLHIYYDSRLEISEDDLGDMDIVKGEAIKRLGTNEPFKDFNAENEKISGNWTGASGFNGVFLATIGRSDAGKDGTMWSITFKLPDNVKKGDVFPIDIIYKSSSVTEDLFLSVDMIRESYIAQAYTFCYGIYNKSFNNNFTADKYDIERVPALAYIDKSYDGYIAVEGDFNSETLYGDANNDGKVTLADAVAVLQYVANKEKYPLSESALDCADVYKRGDGVTGMDALTIQQYDSGTIKILPAE